MRIGRLDVAGEARTIIIDAAGAGVRLLPADVTVLDLLSAPAAERDRLADTGQLVPLDPLGLLAPLDPPSIRDFSVFERHIEGIMMGQGAQIPEIWYEKPFFYFSNPGALSGPGAEIEIPPGSTDLDFELEVAVVVGKAGRNLTPDQAAEHIAGYTIFNDWSARDLQLAEMRLGLGVCKGKDFTNTLGPWIVTPDELERYRVGDRLDLELTAEVNGHKLGGDSLARMAWSFPELLSYASRGTWIRPGDVIGSGTCGGGALIEWRGRHGADEYPWLAQGDTVSLHVQGIGVLTNTVVSGVAPVELPRARSLQANEVTA